jgi:peptidoglycan/LPS O-acetylase OafA/YrhL
LQPVKHTRGGTSGFIPEIESLRGVAITLVFLMHCNLWLPVPAETWVSPLRAFVCAGHTGVSLFFIISGFLLSAPFLREAAGGPRVPRSVYYGRRALRILPLYYAAVGVGVVLCAHRAVDLLRGVPYLLFLNGVPGVVSPLRPYSNVWWSLATEVQFYLLLPALPVVLRSRRGLRWGVGAYVIAYGVIFATTLIPRTVPGLEKLALSVFGRAPLFAEGMLAAWAYDRYGARVSSWAQRTPWITWGAADLVLFSVLALLGVLLRKVVYVGYAQAELTWQWWHVLEGALWTTILLLVLAAPLRTKWILTNAGWRSIGLLSYSIYVIHYPLIVWTLATLDHVDPQSVIGWNVMSARVLPVVAAGCLALSALTYRFIERPFLRRKARLVSVAGSGAGVSATSVA